MTKRLKGFEPSFFILLRTAVCRPHDGHNIPERAAERANQRRHPVEPGKKLVSTGQIGLLSPLIRNCQGEPLARNWKTLSSPLPTGVTSLVPRREPVNPEGTADDQSATAATPLDPRRFRESAGPPVECQATSGRRRGPVRAAEAEGTSPQH